MAGTEVAGGGATAVDGEVRAVCALEEGRVYCACARRRGRTQQFIRLRRPSLGACTLPPSAGVPVAIHGSAE
ncbi:hypothetical protein PR202_ga30440 [Eleusine coracana subsp. coracana]|uniref:Uncharacterized protein n=1 Tax=Eleusine coracana subsp. coracana TaxID=191504 RepID=A0AAV5DNW3_ELECO|nr:hypothetical protein PR202_ga30440 [Eleusine coracana subsp. coracana]